MTEQSEQREITAFGSHPVDSSSARRFHAQLLRVGQGSIGWGILGTGERARQIVQDAIRNQPPLTADLAATWPVGVYSHSEQRARQFAQDHFLPHSFTNLADLLQRREIHCVYIASHPRHHFPLTMAALSAGKHVLCETPLALSLEEAQTMQLAAEHRGLLLGVAHQLRVDPAIRELRHCLADQFIGDLLGGRVTDTTPLYRYQQGWRLQASAGGVIRDRVPRTIDLIRYLLQDEFASVYATSSLQLLNETENSAAEEDVQSIFTLRSSRLTIQAHHSFVIPHVPTVLEFYGTRGTLQIQHWADPGRPSQLFLRQNHRTEALPIPPGDANRQMIATFVHAVRHQPQAAGQPSHYFAPAEAGIRSLEVALATLQSLHTGHVVHLYRS